MFEFGVDGVDFGGVFFVGKFHRLTGAGVEDFHVGAFTAAARRVDQFRGAGA